MEHTRSRLQLTVAGPRSKWITLFVWVLVAVVLSFVFPNVSHYEDNASSVLPNDALSVQANALLQKEFPTNTGTPALIVWYRADGLTDQDVGLIQQVSKELTDHPVPEQTTTIELSNLPVTAVKQMASKDMTLLIEPVFFKENTDADTLKNSIDSLQSHIKAILGIDPFQSSLQTSGLHARISGPVGIEIDATALFKHADFALMLATVLLVFLLLVLIYRSLLLSIIPLIGVGFAYCILSPLLGKIAELGWIQVDSQSISIMTVLLFGAGTDYCLFLITQFRRQLFKESNRHSAIRNALGSTSGAISLSGLTVILALLTLLVAHYGSYHRFAIPFALSILVVLASSLTLVPALLAIFGRASFYPFTPRTEEMHQEFIKKKGKNKKQRSELGTVSRWLGRIVTEKPKATFVISFVILVGLAAFSLNIKYTYNLLDSFPSDMPSREGFSLIARHVSAGQLAPVDVLVNTHGKEIDWKPALSSESYIDSVTPPKKGTIHPDYETFQVIFKQDPYSNASIQAIPHLRDTIERVLASNGIQNNDSNVWIAGETASLYDTKYYNDLDTKHVIPMVIAILALLLLIYFRSPVAMVYLIISVLLSYTASLGAGWMILHYIGGTSAIQGSIPLYAFVFLVALGEDYNIFMISTIWNKRKSTPIRQAIAEGVSQTSGVITSAGLILAGTFAVLATLPIQVLVQFGLVTAVGVLIDTFLVRPFLVPSIAVLLGRHAFSPNTVMSDSHDPSRSTSI